MTTKADWQDQVGRTWAENHQRTDRAFSELTPHLLNQIGAQAGSAIVDIGCGAGELSVAVAGARPDASLIGVDISPALIEVAGRRGRLPKNVRFVVADAAAWAPTDFVPDLYVSRHGVMFFPDPSAAFGHLGSIATPRARMVFSCFRAEGDNAWSADVSRLLALPPSSAPTAPGPFAFADRDHVTAILEGAGWTDVRFEPFDFPYVAGQGEDPVREAVTFFRSIGPSARALRELQGDVRARAEVLIEDWISRHRTGDRVAFDAAAWIVSARRSPG